MLRDREVQQRFDVDLKDFTSNRFFQRMTVFIVGQFSLRAVGKIQRNCHSEERSDLPALRVVDRTNNVLWQAGEESRFFSLYPTGRRRAVGKMKNKIPHSRLTAGRRLDSLSGQVVRSTTRRE